MSWHQLSSRSITISLPSNHIQQQLMISTPYCKWDWIGKGYAKSIKGLVTSFVLWNNLMQIGSTNQLHSFLFLIIIDISISHNKRILMTYNKSVLTCINNLRLDLINKIQYFIFYLISGTEERTITGKQWRLA